MQFQYIPVPLFALKDKRLTPSDRTVLGCIMMFDQMPSGCFATNFQFSDILGTNERTIQRSITHLEELKYIKRTVYRKNARKIDFIYEPPENEKPKKHFATIQKNAESYAKEVLEEKKKVETATVETPLDSDNMNNREEETGTVKKNESDDNTDTLGGRSTMQRGTVTPPPNYKLIKNNILTTTCETKLLSSHVHPAEVFEQQFVEVDEEINLRVRDFLENYNNLLGKKYGLIPKYLKPIASLITQEGYTLEDLYEATKAAKKTDFFRDKDFLFKPDVFFGQKRHFEQFINSGTKEIISEESYTEKLEREFLEAEYGI